MKKFYISCLLIIFLATGTAALFVRTIVNSDIPLWLKIFLLG